MCLVMFCFMLLVCDFYSLHLCNKEGMHEMVSQRLITILDKVDLESILN